MVVGAAENILILKRVGDGKSGTLANVYVDNYVLPSTSIESVIGCLITSDVTSSGNFYISRNYNFAVI